MKRQISLLMIIMMIIALIPNTSFAADRIQEGKVQALKELNLFQGKKNGDDLDQAPTKLESVVMLVRLLGKEQAALTEKHPHPFTDVPKWGAPYVAYAYANDLVVGKSETVFGASDTASAPLFLTFVLRALGYDDQRGDFDWQNAVEVAKVAAIIDSDVNTEHFTRGDAASVCYSSLRGLLRGTKTTLANQLIAEGVFNADTLKKARQLATNPQQKPVAIDRNYKFYAPNDGSGEKVVYLTFDDGPSANVTPRILDILKENDVKATFFVLGKMAERYPQLVRRAYDEGHAIANHSYSHEYKPLYASNESLTAEIKKANDSINQALGFDYGNHLFRFPGGSAGRNDALKTTVYDLGYQYIDWNASSQDAASVKGQSAADALKNTIQTAGSKNQITILCHDAATKSTTADALPSIIKHYQDLGYTFKTLAD